MPVTGLSGGKLADACVLSLPLQRSPCSSIHKGVPLSTSEDMGRPQVMAFLRPGWAGFGPRPGPCMRTLAPLPQASLGSPDPPLSYHTIFIGSLGTCLGKRKPSLPPRGPRDFPWATLPSPSETVCPGKTWGPGDGAGDFPGGSLRARRPLSLVSAHAVPLPPQDPCITG